MNKKITTLYFLAIALAAAAPFAAEAQTIKEWIDRIKSQILVPVISLLFVLATLMFIYGMMKYFIIGAGTPAEIEKGRKLAIYGIVGMALMIGAWGVVYIICGFFPDWVTARLPVAEFMVNPYETNAWKQNQTLLRVIQHIDAGPRHPNSFVVCDSLLIS